MAATNSDAAANATKGFNETEMPKLTPKQKRFVAEYLANGLNATKAAISAGYSEKTAHSQGPRLLENVEISQAIAGKAEKHFGKLDFSVDRTLKEVARLAFFDPKNLFEDDGSLKRITDIDEDTRSVIAGLEVTEIFDGAEGDQKQVLGLLKKIKISDRLSALDKLMRYHSLYNDKISVPGLESLADAISKARKRLA